MPHDRLDDLRVVIPAGGSGTRLWPLSRAGRPKFLLDLTGAGRSLLQQAWDRAVELVPAERIHVVTGTAHASAVAAQLPDAMRLHVEPSGRSSMPAIGLVAEITGREHRDAVLAAFPADHVVDDVTAFATTVAEAVAVARAGRLCTIAIPATGPAIAYGYVEAAEPLDIPGAPSARRVARFVEKPDRETARRYLEQGRFAWNAGMFIGRAALIRESLRRLHPDLHAGLETLVDEVGTAVSATPRAASWDALRAISIDHALAEPLSAEDRVATVPATFGWNDVGDFATLGGLAPSSDGAVLVDASGYVRTEPGSTVVVVGIPDVVVVQTPDAILVTTAEHAQRVGTVPERLSRAGHDELR